MKLPWRLRRLFHGWWWPRHRRPRRRFLLVRWNENFVSRPQGVWPRRAVAGASSRYASSFRPLQIRSSLLLFYPFGVRARGRWRRRLRQTSPGAPSLTKLCLRRGRPGPHRARTKYITLPPCFTGMQLGLICMMAGIILLKEHQRSQQGPPSEHQQKYRYHKKMYKSYRMGGGIAPAMSSNASFAAVAAAESGFSCKLSASSPDELLAYAKRVEADAQRQLADQGLTSCGTCMFSSLTDDGDGQYIVGHQVFMSSLLQHNPNVSLPMIIMEATYKNTSGNGLLQRTRNALQEQYPPTVFVKPTVCPKVPFQWPQVRFLDGKKARARFNRRAMTIFYQRLQLFTFVNCGSIVAVDTADMLVLQPIPHLLSPARILYGTDFAAARRCDARFPDRKNHSWYFNAGLFIVGKRHINAETYASLLSLVISPHTESFFDRREWAADQDVLNAYFDPLHAGQDRTDLSYLDNYAKSFALNTGRMMNCSPPTSARLLHFLGPSKPSKMLSVPIHTDADKKTFVLDFEKFWFASYFREKTIVVGGGPSVRAPAGTYIDMFRRVVRINGFRVSSAKATGKKTTDVIIHKATRRSNFSSLSREHILLADFGENETTLAERMARKTTGYGLRLDQVTRLPSRFYTRLRQEMALAAGVPYLTALAHSTEVYHPLSGTIALEWALRTTTERPVFFVGFDIMLGGTYSHGVQQRVRVVDKKSLNQWHRIDYDRALLRKWEMVEGSVRRLDTLLKWSK